MIYNILGSVIEITSTTVALAMAWLVLYFIYKQMQYENAQRRICRDEDTKQGGQQ